MSSNSSTGTSNTKMGTMMLGALGVVFGDIGTSPLYALKVSIEAAGIPVGGDISTSVYGVLSLITWALIFVVTVKYRTWQSNVGYKKKVEFSLLLHKKSKTRIGSMGYSK